MSHGRSFNRLHRWLAKEHRRLLKQFKDFELPKDELLHKFKQRRAELMGS